MVEVEKVLAERWYGKPVRQHIKEFAQLFGIIFTGITVYWLWVQPDAMVKIGAWFLPGAVIIFFGYRRPYWLYHLWKGWMKLGEFLNMLVSPVLLALFWTVGMVPIAVLLKIFGKRVMDTSYKLPVESYWEVRNETGGDFKQLTKQY